MSASHTHTHTTSYLLENLHCPSCVSLIKSVLQDTFGDRILWVSPNVVTSIVTVEHDEEEGSAALIRGIGSALQDVGFQIAGVDSTVDGALAGRLDPMTTEDAAGEGSWSVMSQCGDGGPWFQGQGHDGDARATHLENCDACRSSAIHASTGARGQTEKKPSFSSTVLSNKTPTSETEELVGIIVTDVAANQTSFWRVTMSIGGMTCASCSNAITAEVEKLPWVLKVAVNLVGNSASIDFIGPEHSQELVGVIEDMGYEASIDQVVSIGGETTKSESASGREVEIKIDGVFCPRCPERILRTLRSLGPSSGVHILREPSFNHPFLKLRYVPDAPRFTVRNILRGIEATDPSLGARIYHPPTLEEKSRDIRARHTRQLLYRELLTLVMAIPTFILGIVYMSLVPKSNPTRRYLTDPWASGLSRLEITLCLLSTPVYFFAADIFHTRAIKELRTLWRPSSRTPLLKRFCRFGSMNMLMSLGTTIAYFSSVAQMIAAAAAAAEAARGDSMIHEIHPNVPEDRFYFDSVVFLTLFLLGGRLIEAYSKSKTGDAVEALAKLRPSTALLIEQDEFNKGGSQSTTKMDMDQLESGDLILVPHGTSPPVDGVVVSGGGGGGGGGGGETKVDESSLTGESRLVKKAPGDAIFAGTINKGPAVTMRVTGASGKSLLDQIVDVVRQGQTRRAPMEQIADVVTSYFVPVITAVAIITWVVWMSLALTHRVVVVVVSSDELNTSGGAGGAVAFAFQFAIAVFVVACPCGLALAAPTAIFVGGGIAAKNGILAKGGGEAFEKASKVGCVVFDKTGTLTVGGEPQITDSIMFPEGEIEGMDSEVLLAGLKAVEECSSHPIAKAIVDFCCSSSSRSSESAELVEGVEELPGKGIKATYKHRDLDIAVGNERLMEELSATPSKEALDTLETWKQQGKSIALVAAKRHNSSSSSGWKVAASLSISDPIREEAIPVIQSLQTRGIQVWMLSGDNVTTAQAVAHRVGIPASHVLAEVLPSEKAAKISYLQATAHAIEEGEEEAGSQVRSRRTTIAMVGDGINDSPALTTADVGIAIGSGSDIAISSADFILSTSNLHSVLALLDLSSAVLRRIKINFAWAAIYNICAVPIAAGCLYPIRTQSGSHVRLDPVWASLAMALSSISVVLSSLSLRTRIPGVGFRRQN